MDDRQKDDPLVLRGLVGADESYPAPREMLGRIVNWVSGRFKQADDERDHIKLRLDDLEMRWQQKS